MHTILRHPIRALRRHLATRTRGQSLVEFALILPVFMLLFAAVLDLGRIAAAEIALENAAREGALQAAVTPTDFDSSQPCPADGASNVVYCRIKLESGGTLTVNPSDVSVTCAPVTCTKGIGNTVTVRVSGRFALLTPLMAALFGGNQNVTFARSATANLETLPTTSPSAAPTSSTAPSAAPSASAAPSGSAAPSASASASASPLTCDFPSAGFTYTISGGGPQNNQVPVTVSVTDTSTSINCGIQSWLWTWGDGTTTLSKTPGSHTYLVKNPDKSGYYSVTLKVTNARGERTSGAVQVPVK